MSNSLDSWLGLNNTITVNAAPNKNSTIIVKHIAGQKTILTGNCLYLHIREPFYSAGKVFHWRSKGSTVGLGINEKIVLFAEEENLKVRIVVGTTTDRYYEISPNEIIQFVKETDSIDYKNGATLHVVPWRICKSVRDNLTSIIRLFHMQGTTVSMSEGASE